MKPQLKEEEGSQPPPQQLERQVVRLEKRLTHRTNPKKEAQVQPAQTQEEVPAAAETKMLER